MKLGDKNILCTQKKKIKYKVSIETLNYIQLNYKLYNFFRVNQ